MKYFVPTIIALDKILAWIILPTVGPTITVKFIFIPRAWNADEGLRTHCRDFFQDYSVHIYWSTVMTRFERNFLLHAIVYH